MYIYTYTYIYMYIYIYTNRYMKTHKYLNNYTFCKREKKKVNTICLVTTYSIMKQEHAIYLYICIRSILSPVTD